MSGMLGICRTPARRLPLQTSFRRCWCGSVDGGRRTNKQKKKMSYFHEVGSEPLRQVTIGNLMTEAADKWPTRTALVSLHEDLKLTFRQAETTANRLAGGFLELGFQPGERLALLGTNSVHWYLAMIAAAKAGLITVNINPAFVARELEYCLKKVGVAGVVSGQDSRGNSCLDTLTAITPEVANTPPAADIRSKKLPNLRRIITTTKENRPGTENLDDVLRLGNDMKNMEELADRIQPDDPTSIQFSSGTTGQPKAALLTHFTTVNNSYFFAKRLEFHKKEHRICLQVPLFHTFGSTLGVLASINHGATLVMPSPKFSPKSSLEAIKRERCSVIYGTPTMYTDLCKTVEDQLGSDEELRASIAAVEVIVSGGATCTQALFHRMSKTFKNASITSVYGMTETSPLVVQTMLDDPLEKRINSVGRVSEHAEIKVVDRDGRMVPVGTPGEVWFRSYAAMLRYWDDPDKTQEIITACGWMKSGDMFILHEDGYGEVVGRLKDVIIRGGENIFPAEVEHILETHPGVLEAQVYGTSDVRTGEEVCASLKLKSGAELTRQDVQSYCRGKMANYKIPKYINFVEDFPKTETGKVKKFVLKEEMEKNKDQCLVQPIS